jgi:ribosomal protein S18 acetylase RimI-like enzyme
MISSNAQIVKITAEFEDYDGLLALIQRAFTPMEDVIDPPSTARNLTVEILRQKAKVETGYLVLISGELAACVFLGDRGDHLYLGKLAVAEKFRGAGLAKLLLQQAEHHASENDFPAIILQVRIELTGNQALFHKAGYRVIAETSHAGFDRVTSLTMQKDMTGQKDIAGQKDITGEKSWP